MRANHPVNTDAVEAAHRFHSAGYWERYAFNLKGGSMYKLMIVVFSSIFFSGCSIHKFVTGDKMPGLAYVSIDKSGNVVSNNKGSAHLFETYDKTLIQGDQEKSKSSIGKNSNRSTLFIWSAEHNGRKRGRHPFAERGHVC